MHPVVYYFLLYVALPVLRCIKAIWPGLVALCRLALLLWHMAHFLTGGVFLPRPPIRRTITKTKTFKLYVESNAMNLPFDEVNGVPDHRDESSRSRHTSSDSTNSLTESSNGQQQERTMEMGMPPFFNVAINTTEEGPSFQYHG